MDGNPAAIPAGTNLGAFRLEALIGEGAFGAVYRAAAIGTGAPAALKVFSRATLERAGGISRFRREAELVSRLSHPNSVRLLGSSEDEGGFLFLAFELLVGRSLEEEIDTYGPVAAKRAALIVIEVLLALEEAHALGLVHRDLKPANVFLIESPHGDRVKVIDFGLAKSNRPGTKNLTRAGNAMGTPLYMAPEQVVGDAVTPRSDVFSLGIVLAEMLWGAPIYTELNVRKVMVERALGALVPIPEEVAESPLGVVVARATQIDPRDRYQSAKEMRDALAKIVSTLSDRSEDKTLDARPSGGTARIARSLVIESTVFADDVEAPTGILKARPKDITRPIPHDARSAPALPFVPASPAPRARRRRARTLLLISLGALVMAVVCALVTFATLKAGSSPGKRPTAARPSTAETAPATASADTATAAVAPSPSPPTSDGASAPFADPLPILKLIKERLPGRTIYAVRFRKDLALVSVPAAGDVVEEYAIERGELEPRGTRKEQAHPGLDLDKIRFDLFPKMEKEARAKAIRKGPLNVIDVLCHACGSGGGEITFGFSQAGTDGNVDGSIVFDFQGELIREQL